MKKHTVTVDEDVRAILQRSVITATSLTLPDEQFERPLYERVNKVLVAAGGKWNRSAKAHVFQRDPREALGLAVETGGIVDQKKARQQFFTPADLAADIVSRAEIRPGMLVLEPSAGAGALAREAAVFGGVVTCVELDEDLRSGLASAGFEVSIARDFMTLPAIAIFDRVVMNPPFEKGQDIDHVTHAFNFLKPGGVLVAIMGAGVESGATKRHLAFRALVQANRGEIELLPAGAFADSGTNVRTVVVTLRRAE